MLTKEKTKLPLNLSPLNHIGYAPQVRDEGDQTPHYIKVLKEKKLKNHGRDGEPSHKNIQNPFQDLWKRFCKRELNQSSSTQCSIIDINC